MSDQPNPSSSYRVREHAERNLSALVITVEFTLISVMVGVILSVLVTNAAPILRDMRFEYWLYILSGLMLILALWTQVITHSLSFIGWPMEFGHNLLYIVFALVLAIQMSFIQDPVAWFVFSLINAAIATVILYYDRRVIERRRSGARGAEAAMFTLALERQDRLIGSAPVTLISAIAMLVLVLLFPNFFIEQKLHILLVTIQILAVGVLLTRTIRNFSEWTEPVVLKAMDELASEGER